MAEKEVSNLNTEVEEARSDDVTIDTSSRQYGQLRGVSPSATGHLALAKLLLKKGRFQLAVAEVDRALRKNPEWASAYLTKGLTLIKLAKFDEAKQCLLTALQLQSDLYLAWRALAFVEREFGHYEEALNAIQKAIKVDPKNAGGHLFHGSLLQMMNRKTEAAAALRESVRLHPQSKIAHYKLGSVLLELGQPDEAEQQILAAHRLNPMDYSSRLALGDLHLARGQIEQAIQHYKSVIDLAPRKAAIAQAKLGEAYYEMGRLQEAIVSSINALRHNPKQVHSRVLLARIYLQLNQPEDAVQSLEAAIQLDDRFPEAQKLLVTAREALGR